MESDHPDHEMESMPDESSSAIGKVTINDIARFAKVSKKTVSRVINNSPLVRDETRRRVEKIISTYGYSPDPQARALAFRRSFLIGMIYDNPSPQYVVNMQRGILDALEGTSFQLVLSPCDRSDPNVHERLRNFVVQQKPRGVILTPSISEDERVAKMLRDHDCPYVRIASMSLDRDHCMIRTHDFEGAAAAARHIARLGHRRIGHVTGPDTFLSAGQRKSGFENGLSAFGLSLDAELTVAGAYTYQSGLDCTRALLALPSPPTALFCGNDEMAVGAYQAAREKGLRVPEDLSIVGFDDTPMASRVWPTMTTVRLEIREMGLQAARLLLADPSERGVAPAISFMPQLIERNSTAALGG